MGRRLKNERQLIAEIKDKLLITDGIERLMRAEIHGRRIQTSKVQWRRSGAGEWKMVCPFHDDHSPSLDVNEVKGLWTCRSASCVTEVDGKKVPRGGDLISFARELHSLTYMEALRVLCELAEVDIDPYLAKPTEAEQKRDRARQSLAQHLNQLPFLTVWPGKPKITKETLKKFGVRECPGHVKVAQDGTCSFGSHSDEKSYVILPLVDDEGDLVGWTTRSLEDSSDSRNNPNDWIGARNDVLYGLQQIRSELRIYGHKIIGVEGQTDALSMHSVGMKNVVSLRGVALTDAQWRLLEKWKIREFSLCLDGDEGGKTATPRLAEHYWNRGNIILSIATLPDGTDPDQLLTDGRDSELILALTRPVGNGSRAGRLVDSVEYILAGLETQFDIETLSGRRAFIERALNGLKMSQATGYLRKLIVAWISERFNMPTLEVADIFVEQSTPVVTITSEQSVLARAMRDPDWMMRVIVRVGSEHFLFARHQAFWQLLKHAISQGLDTSDRVALTEFAERHGYAKEIVAPAFLDELGERYTESDYPLDSMMDGAFRRAVAEGSAQVRTEMHNANIPARPAVDAFAGELVRLSFWRDGAQRNMTKEEQVEQTLDLLAARRANPDEIVGHDLGPCFPKLNLAMRGIRTGRLHVVAAAQSVGKTSFLNNMVAQFCIHKNIPGLLVGLEMGYEEYHHRLLAQMTGIDASRIESSRLTDEETALVARAAQRLASAPLWIYTPDTLNQDELVMAVRGYKLEHRIEVVFYDYAQLTDPTREQARMTRYERMGELAKTMKMQIARAMDVAFITAAQLNREGAKEKKPTAEHIGDSYQIAQTADSFLILTEPEGNETALDLFVDKNRQGRKDILIPLRFDRATQVIRESEHGEKTPPYRVR